MRVTPFRIFDFSRVSQSWNTNGRLCSSIYPEPKSSKQCSSLMARLPRSNPLSRLGLQSTSGLLIPWKPLIRILSVNSSVNSVIAISRNSGKISQSLIQNNWISTVVTPRKALSGTNSAILSVSLRSFEWSGLGCNPALGRLRIQLSPTLWSPVRSRHRFR